MQEAQPKTDTKEKAEVRLNTSTSLSDQMIRKAYQVYLEREARRAAVKAPHKDKVKKARRARNKAARASRRGNR